MNPTEFLKSIYLGDRACKALLIDSWKKRMAIQVNVVSDLLREDPGQEEQCQD